MAERDQKRAQIIALSENSSMSQAEIATYVGLNQSSVSRIIKQHRETGSYATSYENCGGHNKKLTERDYHQIKRIALNSPKATANDIKNKMGPIGDVVSTSTVKRALYEMGFKAKKPLKKPILTPQHQAARLAWAHRHQNWTLEMWRNVIFSDETMVYIGEAKSKFVRVLDGYPLTDKHYTLTSKFPKKIMMWSCFSYFGPGRSQVIEKTLNSAEYIENIITHRVLPQINEWFPNGQAIFQQDNAPAHVSKASLNKFQQCGIHLLEWPAQSCDLNPIENLWALVKHKIAKNTTESRQEAIASFLRVWHRDPDMVALCQKLVDSMPRRVAAVIASKGGHTDY